MDPNGRLRDAIRTNNSRRAKAALAAGADPNHSIDSAGHTPLYHAAKAGRLDLVHLLMAAGARPAAEKADGTSLHAAAAAGHGQILQLLLQPPRSAGKDRFDASGRTPLMRAVESGDLASVQALLDRGADPNARSPLSLGNTALRIAAAQASLDIVKALLAAGADPLLPGRMNLTPLDRARERRTPEGRMITALILRKLEGSNGNPTGRARPASRQRRRSKRGK